VSAEATLALAVVAFATSALSAVLGMAGGMLLLGALLLVTEPLVALPLHAVVQAVSNGSRAVHQARHVDWGIAASFMWPLLPAGALGLALAERLPPDALRLAIAAWVLLATWRPAWLPGPTRAGVRAPRRFALLGAVLGFLNVNVGATGFAAQPWFLAAGLPRQAVIGTGAVCQLAGHLAKILLFGAAGFAFAGFAAPLVALSAASLAGTRAGTFLLHRLDERPFRQLSRALLTLLALQLLLEGLAARS